MPTPLRVEVMPPYPSHCRIRNLAYFRFFLSSPAKGYPCKSKNDRWGQRAMLKRRARKAYSLLEVVLAGGICASALVPALAFMRDGLTLAEAIDARHLMLMYGVSKMEEQLAIVSATWTDGTANGDFAADGHANIRYSLSRSDAPASGGINNRLMNVSITTYWDDDGDDAMDPSEMRTILTTKIGKSVSYENKAAR